MEGKRQQGGQGREDWALTVTQPSDSLEEKRTTNGDLAFSAQSVTKIAVVPVEAAALSQSKSKVDVELKVVLPLWCLDEEWGCASYHVLWLLWMDFGRCGHGPSRKVQ